MDDIIKLVILIAIVAVLAVGLAFLSDNYTNWDVASWFDWTEEIASVHSGYSGLYRWQL